MKFALTLLMVVASWFMYDHRDLVFDAYRESDSDVDIRLTGIDLDVEQTPLPSSPFQIRSADDTRRKPLDLAFVDVPTDAIPVDMSGGDSTLSGTAFVDDGPADGAVVRIERHTANTVGSIDVTADNRGRWSAGGLPGGRYRLRSWIEGKAVDKAGTVLFVEAGESHSHSFRLTEVDDDVSVQINNSGVMFDGLTGSVGVAVSQRQVDGDGLIVNAPVPNAQVVMTVTGAAKLESPASASVDSSGHATFRLRCVGVGSVTVSAVVSIPGVTRSPASSGQDGSTSASTSVAVGDGEAPVRAVGRHPGCRAIPPPPTTAPAVDGEAGVDPDTSNGGGPNDGSGGTNAGTGTTPTTRSDQNSTETTSEQQSDVGGGPADGDSDG